MPQITKEDIRNAFLNNRMKRHWMLYNFYKVEYFYPEYTSTFVAEKLSKELEVKITDVMIRQIRAKFAKKDPQYRVAVTPTPAVTEPKGISSDAPVKVQKEYYFPNADDLPKKDPFKDAFAHLEKIDPSKDT